MLESWEEGKWIVVLDSSVGGPMGEAFELFMEEVTTASPVVQRVIIVGRPKVQYWVPKTLSEAADEEELFRLLQDEMWGGLETPGPALPVTVTFLGPAERGERIRRFVRESGHGFRLEGPSFLAFLKGLNVNVRTAEEMAAGMEEAISLGTGA